MFIIYVLTYLVYDVNVYKNVMCKCMTKYAATSIYTSYMLRLTF